MLSTSSRASAAPGRVVALIVAVGLTLAVALPAAGRPAGSASTGQRIISPRPTAKEFSRARFSRPLVIDNRWTPLIPGTEFVLDGVVREGRKVLKHRIVSLVTDLTKIVDGIPTVVVWERDFSQGRLQESELFFAAQDDNKNVWLFGEYPELWRNGRFEGAPDTWLAPTFGTQPGVFMYQSPRVGQIFSEGYAPHIKFYDRARVLRKGLKICTPARCYKQVMETDEYAPYNPGDAHQRKFYAQGFGTILAKPAGEPNPETVSLHRVRHLRPGTLAAARAGVLKTEARAYNISDAYRQTPPAVPRSTAGPSYDQVKTWAEAYKGSHSGNGGKDWDINAKTPAQLASDRAAARLVSICGADQRPVIPIIAWEYGGVDHQWINPSASALVYCVHTPVRNATSHWGYDAAATRVTADVYVKYPDQNPCRTMTGRYQVAGCIGDVTNLEILVDTASLHDGADAGFNLAGASTELRLIMPHGRKVQLVLNI